MFFFRMFIVVVGLLLPLSAFAAGAHDGLVCTGCHGLHTAKESTVIFAVEANKKDISPKTKQPFGGITSLCLGCHETPEKGGMGIKPIAAHMSHPFGFSGVNSKVAHVPNELLRDGRFECVACHDPHPSNPNYKYLRVDTGGGSKMDGFCAVCHPMKVAPKTAAQKPQFFNSMDEGLFGASGSYAPAAPAEAPAPKAKKK